MLLLKFSAWSFLAYGIPKMTCVVFILKSLIFCEFVCLLLEFRKFWHTHQSKASSFTVLCCGQNKFLLLILNLLCTTSSGSPLNCPPCVLYAVHDFTHVIAPPFAHYPYESFSTDHFCCTSLDLLFCHITVSAWGEVTI